MSEVGVLEILQTSQGERGRPGDVPLEESAFGIIVELDWSEIWDGIRVSFRV